MIKSLFSRQSIVMVGAVLQQQSSLTWLRCSERRWDHHQRDHNHPHHDHNHNCFDHYSHHPPNQSCHHYHRCKTMWRTVVSTSGFFSSSLKEADNIVLSCSGNISNPPAKITIFDAESAKLTNTMQTRSLRGVRAIPHRGTAGGYGGEEGRRE